MSISQTILDIAEICTQQGVNKLILSPGSRNAPLTLAFTRHPDIVTRVISDERAAGYIALGMSQSLKQPVMLLSTSGTAALNFGPSIAEAYYQRIPLLVFTADRPPEWIDQNDGQAIRQRSVFKNHVKKSYELPVSLEHEDARWQVYRTINEIIITARTGAPGPVHINVPLREPLYPEADQSWKYRSKVPVINFRQTNKNLSPQQWDKLKEQWTKASKILIVGGQSPYSSDLTVALENLKAHAKVPVVGDVVSNLHRTKGAVIHPEIILGQPDTTLEQLQPELLVTFGGDLVSKNLKLFLRKYSAPAHWHVQESGYPPDTFKSLSDIIPLDPVSFFDEIKARIPGQQPSSWFQEWQEQELAALKWISKFLQQQDFNELGAVQQVLKASESVHLHLANSSPVRWVDLLGAAPSRGHGASPKAKAGDERLSPAVTETIEVSANRGTSGIDGCSSAAVGHSFVNDRLNLLITGDMAFFYDRNAFWHQYEIPNLKIVMLNNHGGGIFRLIDGPRKQPELDHLFVTNQSLSAENSAKDFGMKYLYCNNATDLTKNLELLFEPSHRACILEIEFPNNMGEIYQKLKAGIRNHYE